MKEIVCPKCGFENLYGNIEWKTDENGDLDLKMDDNGVFAVGTCPKCGKEVQEVFTRTGIFDPEAQEYLVRD